MIGWRQIGRLFLSYSYYLVGQEKTDHFKVKFCVSPLPGNNLARASRGLQPIVASVAPETAVSMWPVGVASKPERSDGCPKHPNNVRMCQKREAFLSTLVVALGVATIENGKKPIL